MPKGSRKRKASGRPAASGGGAPAANGSEAAAVPEAVRRKIRRVIGAALPAHQHSSGRAVGGGSSNYKEEPCESSEDAIAAKVQAAFADELELPHVDRGEIRAALRADGDHEDDASPRLIRLAEAMHAQTRRAVRVFEMLDEAGKGVVVVEDLRRVAPDILGDGSVGGGTGGSSWKDADLIEMVTLVDRSTDGILTKDDVIRVARKVGL